MSMMSNILKGQVRKQKTLKQMQKVDNDTLIRNEFRTLDQSIRSNKSINQSDSFYKKGLVELVSKQTQFNMINKLQVQEEPFKNQKTNDLLFYSQVSTHSKFSVENNRRKKNQPINIDYLCFQKQLSAKSRLVKEETLRFDDIGESIVIPNLFPEKFENKPLPQNSFLLYGPPGVGKTMMAKAVINEINAYTIWVNFSELIQTFDGESDVMIAMIFKHAQANSPSLIIIDEMDQFLRQRQLNESQNERKIKTEFLRQMDEIENNNVSIMATTNVPWDLDCAALRRFQQKIYLPIPNLKARKEILRICLGPKHKYLTQKQISEISLLTEGYSGSDLRNLVNDAKLNPLRELLKAQYFQKVRREAVVQDKELSFGDQHSNTFKDGYQFYYVPCNEHDENSIKVHFNELNKQQTFVRDISHKDILLSLNNCRATISEDIVKEHLKFLEQFGHGQQFKESREKKQINEI